MENFEINTKTITEVSELLEIPESTLRLWEENYGFKISRGENGNRKYTDLDIEILGQIKEMRRKGLTKTIIKTFLQRSEAGQEKEQTALEAKPIGQMTSAEMMGLFMNQFSDLLDEQRRGFEEKIEQAVEVIKQELEIKNEQLRQENESLKDQIASSSGLVRDMLSEKQERDEQSFRANKEGIVSEIAAELQRQNQQQKAENQKLMEYISGLRKDTEQQSNKPSFLERLFGRGGSK